MGAGTSCFHGFCHGVAVLGGIFAYFTLEQREDPKFTFRLMVVKTLYPGATALEVENQVTDRLEKKLQELPNLDYVRSYSKPGESVIFVTPREDIPATEIAYLWYQVRKKIADIKPSMPPGVIGPFSTMSLETPIVYCMPSLGKILVIRNLRTLLIRHGNKFCV